MHACGLECDSQLDMHVDVSMIHPRLSTYAQIHMSPKLHAPRDLQLPSGTVSSPAPTRSIGMQVTRSCLLLWRPVDINLGEPIVGYLRTVSDIAAGRTKGGNPWFFPCSCIHRELGVALVCVQPGFSVSP